MRRARYPGRRHHQLRFWRGEDRRGGGPRRGVARGRAKDRHGHRRAELRGRRQPAAPAGRDLQPGIPRPEPAAAAERQPRQADRRQLPVGRADLRVPQSRPRPPAQIHLPDQRRQPDRAGGARLCRLGARRRRRRHLHVLPRTNPRRGALPRRRRPRRRRRQADDRRQGRAFGCRAARRLVTYRGIGAGRGRRRRDLPASRHHPRRRPRPYGRCRDRLRLLLTANGQPGRDHHRLGRQRGVDGRCAVGARPRTAGARRRHPAPHHGPAAVLCLGAEPDRRDGAGDRRGRLPAADRTGAAIRSASTRSC